MSSHVLVSQLHFARSELSRCLAGLSEADGRRRLMPMNCISWIVGHLADQEHRYWVVAAQGRVLVPELNDLAGGGKPASTPPLAEMWDTWRAITATADVYLGALAPATMDTHLVTDGKPLPESVGTMLLRNIYHYWFHIGEAHAIRQMLGHANLPQFVGDMSSALYRRE